jgi:uncharacterized membrane protein
MRNQNFGSGVIDASGCISTAWALVQRNFGMYIGSGLVAWLMISCIPCANIFLLGPVMGGFAFLVLRDLRNEPVEFGMLFKGFEKFVPLMVIGLLQMIPAIIFQVIQMAVDLGRIGITPGRGNGDFYQASQMNPVLAGFTAAYLILIVGFLVFQIIWNAAFMFAIPLVLENNIGAGEAIKLSLSAVFANIGGIILLMILGSLVMILGAIAFCIGIFVALPVIWAANVIAYRQVFSLLSGNFYTGPPPPTAYGSSFGQGM